MDMLTRRGILWSLLLTGLLALPGHSQDVATKLAPALEARPAAPALEVRFSPRGGCTEAIVREIAAARREVLVQAYSFTSPAIAQALVQAHHRGIDVRVICDRGQRTARNSEAARCRDAGIEVLFDAKHAIAHNKIMIFDSRTVVTGSFNFTRAAEDSNAENLLILRDRDMARLYRDNWLHHAGHSER